MREGDGYVKGGEGERSHPTPILGGLLTTVLFTSMRYTWEDGLLTTTILLDRSWVGRGILGGC